MMYSVITCGLLPAPSLIICASPLNRLRCAIARCAVAADAEDDLTLAAVGTLFPSMSELAALPDAERMLAMEGCLKKRLVGLQLSRVCIAKSTVEGAGMGLFAARDIRANELVTMYPCDTLVTTVPARGNEGDEEMEDEPTPSTWPELAVLSSFLAELAAISDEDGLQAYAAGLRTSDVTKFQLIHQNQEAFAALLRSQEAFAALLNQAGTLIPAEADELYFDVNAPIDSEWYSNWAAQDPEFIQRAWSYSVRISALRAVVGDPTATDDDAYLAHMANDFASCTEADETSTTVYTSSSEAAANVGLDSATTNGCHVVMVATKHIREGEEIFLSYGSNYWLGPGRLAGRSSQ